MNMANYAKGLLDELEGAIRTGSSDLEAQIRAELEQIAPEARKHVSSLHGMVEDKMLKVNGSEEEVENKLVGDIRAIGERLDAALAPKETKAAAKAPATR